jgi:glycosyltransferase involved in cell wall biosynthesis
VYGLSANVSAICERVRRVALDFRPEVVQAESASLGDALGVVAGATRILTVYDPAVRLRENVGVRDARLPVVHELDAWCARREERRALQLADAVVVFTDDDRRLVAGGAPSATPVTTIPLGWDVPAVPLDPVGGEPPAIVFAGDYGHPPNVDAALRLACEVLPRVHAHHPDVRLELIGPDPPPKLVALAGERVEVPGRVPSILARLDRAAIVVTPISIGGGMRVKVIEALAAGKALVASPRALAGLDVRDGEQVLVADGGEETATAVTRVLTDVGLRVRLARCAREWAEQTLSWSAMADRYDELYASLAGAHRELEGVRG